MNFLVLNRMLFRCWRQLESQSGDDSVARFLETCVDMCCPPATNHTTPPVILMCWLWCQRSVRPPQRRRQQKSAGRPPKPFSPCVDITRIQYCHENCSGGLRVWGTASHAQRPSHLPLHPRALAVAPPAPPPKSGQRMVWRRSSVATCSNATGCLRLLTLVCCNGIRKGNVANVRRENISPPCSRQRSSTWVLWP
jgi:hypothetical protein